jgi:protein subunit release factor A
MAYSIINTYRDALLADEPNEAQQQAIDIMHANLGDEQFNAHVQLANEIKQLPPDSTERRERLQSFPFPAQRIAQ